MNTLTEQCYFIGPKRILLDQYCCTHCYHNIIILPVLHLFLGELIPGFAAISSEIPHSYLLEELTNFTLNEPLPKFLLIVFNGHCINKIRNSWILQTPAETKQAPCCYKQLVILQAVSIVVQIRNHSNKTLVIAQLFTIWLQIGIDCSILNKDLGLLN